MWGAPHRGQRHRARLGRNETRQEHDKIRHAVRYRLLTTLVPGDAFTGLSQERVPGPRGRPAPPIWASTATTASLNLPAGPPTNDRTIKVILEEVIAMFLHPMLIPIAGAFHHERLAKAEHERQIDGTGAQNESGWGVVAALRSRIGAALIVIGVRLSGSTSV